MTRIQTQLVNITVNSPFCCNRKLIPFIFICLAFLIIYPVSSVAQAGKISAEKKEIIKASLLRSPQFSEKHNRNIAQRMIDVYKAGNPNLSPRAFQIVIEEVRKNNRKLLEQIIPIYDKFFTLKELRNISAFSNSKVSHKFNRVMPLMIKQEPGLKNPKLSAEQKANIYKKYFTPEELRSVSNFFNSPTGRKMARVGPQIEREVKQVRQSWIQKSSAAVTKRIQKRFKKEGIKTLP
ncbi:MAG: DUF2059 domain-containing protein [Desulfobacterales bacterium]|nr:DUF2059 domain-containing protein [Deltaproteobacteria bacterium]NNL41698.1 DUF2059 domain-containing protein [Desulfobacterales bacterium]